MLLRIYCILTIFLVVLSACSNNYEGVMSDHFDGNRFFDPMQKENHGGFSQFLKWRFLRKEPKWPQIVEVEKYDIPPKRVHDTQLRVSYVGHVTYLIQTGSLNILTDPVWSERVSPVRFAGPKRVIAPGIRFEDLPPIDVVVISHNHYDHLDIDTIGKLWKVHKPKIIVPLGNDKIIKSYDKNIEVQAYDWGDIVAINSDVKIHLHPSTHWSARGIFDKNEALWASFNIQTPGGNIYFVGDSGYGDGVHFKSAKEKFGSFRLALLPIGAYTPRWFMRTAHMDPEEALLALSDLGAQYMIPGHFDVFPLADEQYGDAIRKLDEAKLKFGISDRVRLLKVGQFFEVPL